MERRVQLVKKDSEREKHRIFQGFEVDEKPEAEPCEKLPLECPQDLLEPPPTLQPKHFPYGRNGKGHKRYTVHGGLHREMGGTLLSPSVYGAGTAQWPLRCLGRPSSTRNTSRCPGKPQESLCGECRIPKWWGSPSVNCLSLALVQQPWFGGAGNPPQQPWCLAQLLFLLQEANVWECREEDAC